MPRLVKFREIVDWDEGRPTEYAPAYIDIDNIQYIAKHSDGDPNHSTVVLNSGWAVGLDVEMDHLVEMINKGPECKEPVTEGKLLAAEPDCKELNKREHVSLDEIAASAGWCPRCDVTPWFEWQQCVTRDDVIMSIHCRCAELSHRMSDKDDVFDIARELVKQWKMRTSDN